MRTHTVQSTRTRTRDPVETRPLSSPADVADEHELLSAQRAWLASLGIDVARAQPGAPATEASGRQALVLRSWCVPVAGAGVAFGWARSSSSWARSS